MVLDLRILVQINKRHVKTKYLLGILLYFGWKRHNLNFDQCSQSLRAVSEYGSGIRNVFF